MLCDCRRHHNGPKSKAHHVDQNSFLVVHQFTRHGNDNQFQVKSELVCDLDQARVEDSTNGKGGIVLKTTHGLVTSHASIRLLIICASVASSLLPLLES